MRFVNREAEKTLINDAFRALHHYQEELLRTPILDFYGIAGIGKTSILDHVEQQCKDQAIPYIRVNETKNARQLAHEIIQQAGKYNIRLALQDDEEGILQQSAYVTRALLDQGVAVLLLDAIDDTNEGLITQITDILREVIEENKLFVVLTSRKSLLFERERTVARKLTAFQLKPFDRKSCTLYLESMNKKIDAEVRSIIYDWTHGYPLAVEVMAWAIIKHKLDPRKPEHHKELLSYLVKEVINERILARIESPARRDECLAAFTLLSIPRRFNLTIMQDLIEHFTPALKQASSIAYTNFPRKINQQVNMLSWNMLRAGYAVDDSVRAIFAIKNKIEDSERYFAIHRLLVQLNKELADTVQGTDRVRYLRESLYHSTYIEKPEQLQQTLKQVVEIVTTSDTLFEQFHEEFLQDKELQEALGEQTDFIVSLLYQHLSWINGQSARRASGAEQMQRLQDYFYYKMKDPLMTDQQQAIGESIREIQADVLPERVQHMIDELLHDDAFKKLLGKHFASFSSIIQAYRSLEG